MVGCWPRILSGGTEVSVEQEQGRTHRKGKIVSYYDDFNNEFIGRVSPNTLLDDADILGGVIVCSERYLSAAKAHALKAVADEIRREIWR